MKRMRVLLCCLACLWSLYAWSNETRYQRIVALSPHSVELLFLLGVGENIVGTTEFADFPEAAQNIPRLGGYNGIQMDRLLALEPDLIIVWTSGIPKADIDRMQRMQLNVVLSETNALGDIPNEIERLGALLGREDIAHAKAEFFRERVAALKKAHDNSEPVTFFYQLWSEPLRTVGAGSWINEIFAGCGGVNIFADPALDYPQVSIETVIERSPEVIVVPTHHGGEIAVDMWRAWPEIPAVKNNTILFFDGDLLHRFSYRVLEGMETVCSRFDAVRSAMHKP